MEKRIFGTIDATDMKDKKENLKIISKTDDLKMVRNRTNIVRWYKEKIIPKQLMQRLKIDMLMPTEEKTKRFYEFVGATRDITAKNSNTTNKGYRAKTDGYTVYNEHDIVQFWSSGEMALYLCAYKHKLWNKPTSKYYHTYVWRWQLCTGIQDVDHHTTKTDNQTGTTSKVVYWRHQNEIESVRVYLKHKGITTQKYDYLLTSIKRGTMTKEQAIKEIKDGEGF